jgi:hypothetical protein
MGLVTRKNELRDEGWLPTYGEASGYGERSLDQFAFEMAVAM